MIQTAEACALVAHMVIARLNAAALGLQRVFGCIPGPGALTRPVETPIRTARLL